MQNLVPVGVFCRILKRSLWARCRFALFLGFAAITAGCVSVPQERLAQEAIALKNVHGTFDKKLNCVRGLKDQGLLAKVAMESEDPYVRDAAVAKLRDQDLLAKVAMEAKNEYFRKPALSKLKDQTLAKMGFWVKPELTKQLTNQNLLVTIALEAKDWKVRNTAVKTLTEQTLLAKVAIEAKCIDVRKTAVEMLTDQALLAKVAVEIKYMSEISELKLVAETAELKRVAETMIAVEDKDSDVRKALERILKWEDPAILAKKREFDVLCATAARALRDPALIESAALQAENPVVLRILLAAISDNPTLDRIAEHATSRAMRLAAARKSGSRSWDAIFSSASKREASKRDMGDAIAAVALFEAKQADAVEAVRHACRCLIDNGDESRIPEMVDLLEEYGDEKLAVDYLNCGQPDLYTAGRNWGRRRGFDVGSGRGSIRAHWGSSR